MAFDSTIRLRQLNQPELSGFISGIISSSPKQDISGNIIPASSGVYSLGSSTSYYNNIYTNQLNLPSGSGIKIGGSFLTAYSSGGAGVVQIDGYKISSSGNFISIQGPIGPTGATGLAGPSGSTGVSVTGIKYDEPTYKLQFYLSNGVLTGVYFPPFSGASGVGITGFFQSGDYIFPQYNHGKVTGEPILLPVGPEGPPGSINFYFQSGLNCAPDPIHFPSEVVLKDYYSILPSPRISMMRGMAYNFDFSGLKTHAISTTDYALLTASFPSINPGLLPQVGTSLNYFAQDSQTGFWRLVFFPSDTAVGTYLRPGSDLTNKDLFENIEVINNQIYGDTLDYNSYHTSVSLTTNFTANSLYKYGFALYSLGDGVVKENLITGFGGTTGYACVLGFIDISSGIGPAGPQGIKGDIGVAGPPGVGIKGDQGSQGIGIQDVIYDASSLQFKLSDGSLTQIVPLPSSGPAGADGPTGPVGSLINYFAGEYSSSTFYNQNDTITSNGSTYIYVNSTPTANNLPPNAVFWQLLAQKGDIGPSGATGIADRYSSRFSVVSGSPTGAGTYRAAITGITIDGVGYSGSNVKIGFSQTGAFVNSGIVGYSYTPNQKIIISSNDYTFSRFSATVISYVPNSGLISFLMDSGIGTITGNATTFDSVNNKAIWSNYGNSTINIGTNLVSGAIGPQGIVGPPGVPSLLRSASEVTLDFNVGASVTLDPLTTDIFNITIQGHYEAGAPGISINFNWTNFDVGKSILLRIKNNGILGANSYEPPLFDIQEGVGVNKIYWPNGVYGRPEDGCAYIYTILKFPDACYGTYSNPYVMR